MSSVLLNTYQQAVAATTIHYDEKQWQSLQLLQVAFDQINSPPRLFSLLPHAIVKGVYLYGPVGAGKTYLMDLFYNQLTIKNKMRIHFHQFMKMIHESLAALQGHKNPLKIVAKELAKKTKIICFDEFFVLNIVDAMVLANLLNALYAEKMTLIMTSNIEPDNLYKDGLQREQFLPAIELIKKNNSVIAVNAGTDYRLEKADYERAYFYPQDSETQELLLSQFRLQGESTIEIRPTIRLNDRNVAALYRSKKAIWFDFLVLCSIPRSQLDYIALTEQYEIVFLSGLRQIDCKEHDLIYNFINLIDVFYDAHVKLIIMSSVPMKMIYPVGIHTDIFARTESRLSEMQSQTYLQTPRRVL